MYKSDVSAVPGLPTQSAHRSHKLITLQRDWILLEGTAGTRIPMPSLKEKRRGINIFQQLLKQLGTKMNIDFGRLIINDSRPLVFILSGAGLSAESGIPTFRGKDGLWKNWYPSEIASDTALKERPEDVFEFYNFRIGKAVDCLPNAAHTSDRKSVV